MRVEAIVLAAGKGTRMGAGMNKVYLTLLGRPILSYSLELLQKSSLVSSIILVAAPGEEATAKSIIKEYGIDKASHIVTGGASRYDSVSNALKVVDETTDLIAVHDGARPLLTDDDLGKVIAAAEMSGGAILAYPLHDSIKSANDSHINASLDRSCLWGAMTPQVFSKDKLLKAYEIGDKRATDDSQLVESIGCDVVIVEGSKENIKMTTPMDMMLAELLLKARGRA